MGLRNHQSVLDFVLRSPWLSLTGAAAVERFADAHVRTIVASLAGTSKGGKLGWTWRSEELPNFLAGALLNASHDAIDAELVLGSITWQAGEAWLETPVLITPVRLSLETEGTWRCEPLGEAVANPSLVAWAAGLAQASLEPGEQAVNLDELLQGALGRALWVRGSFTTGMLLAQLGAPLAPWLNRLGAAEVPRAVLGAVSSTQALALPLDADAAQRACVATLAAGASVRLDGVSGTGRTQTVANAIAHAMRLGQSVLVATAAAPRRDRLRERLDAIGLTSGVVQLSTPTAGQPLAGQLLTTLTSTWRPVGAASAPGDEHARAQGAAELAAYHAALHTPMADGRTLFQALGELDGDGTLVPAIADEAVGLDAAGLTALTAIVSELGACVAAVAPLSQHPLRDVEVPRDVDLEAHGTLLTEGLSVARQLVVALAEFEAAVPGVSYATRADLEALMALCEVASQGWDLGLEVMHAIRSMELAPTVNALAKLHHAFTPPREPTEYLELALLRAQLAERVDELWLPTVRTLDIEPLADQYARAMEGASAMRYLRLRPLRQALREHLRTELPDDGQLRRAVDIAYAERRATNALLKVKALASHWFGGCVIAGELDLAAVRKALVWATEARRCFDDCTMAASHRERVWRQFVARLALDAPAAVPFRVELYATLTEASRAWFAMLGTLRQAWGLELRDEPLERALTKLAGWEAGRGRLAEWQRYCGARAQAQRAGLHELIAQLEAGQLEPRTLPATWQRAVSETLVRAALSASPVLRTADGTAMGQALDSLARLERARQAAARVDAVASLVASRPLVQGGHIVGYEQDAGAAALDTEAAWLRQVHQAGQAISVPRVISHVAGLWPRLARCVMAPATQVPALLPDPCIFDLVIVTDAELLASPELMVLASYGKQLLLVGDWRLARLDDAWRGALVELALGLRYRGQRAPLLAAAQAPVQAAPLPQRSPATEASTSLPLVAQLPLVEPPVGRARGRKRAAVAWTDDSVVARELALALALCKPHRERCGEAGVIAQRELALVVPTAWHHRAAVQALAGLATEGLVIHLVDGHAAAYVPSADTVVVCLGFWPSGEACADHGYAEGPALAALLQSCVLAATQELVVVGAGEVAAARLQGLPAAALCAVAAEAVPALIALPPDSSHRLARVLATGLRERGWEVELDVEGRHRRIDLAVVDPSDASSYVLAIVFDSDRLLAVSSPNVAEPAFRYDPETRAYDAYVAWPAHLQALGWRVHRVWALDMLRNESREVTRAHGAIVAALAQKRQAQRQRPAARLATGTLPPVMAAREPSVPNAVPKANLPWRSEAARALASGSVPLPVPDGLRQTAWELRVAIGQYLAAYVPSGRRLPGDLLQPKYAEETRKLIHHIMAAESPMHIGLLARRVASYFGMAQVTDEVVARVVELAGDTLVPCWEPDVVWAPSRQAAVLPTVRVAPSQGAGRREIWHVPLMEIAAAVRLVAERAPGLGVMELLRETAKLLGFARYTDEVAQRLAQGLEVAREVEVVSVRDAAVYTA